jgi:hypothetical protein
VVPATCIKLDSETAGSSLRANYASGTKGHVGVESKHDFTLAGKSPTEAFVMSTPTPTKYESTTSVGSAFTWTFPGSPICIDFPLDLISRLRAELDQHENLASSASGSAIGGVLLGHRKTPTTLEIDDYIWVSSEEQPGSCFHLETSQLKHLRFVYTVVGYFRTQPEDNLGLRDEEISFVGKHFRDPTNVVLLIQTSPHRYTAGFFFWMREGVFAPVSFMDFPLDAELLRLQAVESDSIDAQGTQSAEDGGTTLPLRATTGNDAAMLTESASTSGEQSIFAPSGDMRISLRLRTYLERLWARSSICVAADRPLNQTELSGTTPQETAATNEAPARISQRMLVASGMVFAVLTLAGLSAVLLRDGSPGSRQKAPPTVAAFPLELDVEAQRNALNIRWNPHSAPVTQAREAHLVILEGKGQPRAIPLDRQLLTSGHVYYRSSAERVQFELEIVDNSGRISRESVLALSSKP